ncbi:right-handed parallel beta-helix repeat-containing protein [Demequina gelatinilytica]|uniref:right-handed parallel beta-helix repeat-containing protein n=1 Tax=Demequina gelatinilytica TaxID=1638980 RepID=UPI0007846151|nr:right-handed parallel beta-helix repeat-containing protein [Demequina gelatinilytica]
MAKWQFNRPGSWDYATLDIRATFGDVLEADFAPDAWWDEVDESTPATIPATPSSGVIEPSQFSLQAYDRGLNHGVWKSLYDLGLVPGAPGVRFAGQIQPSGDTSGMTDRLAIMAELARCGVAHLAPGRFYINDDLLVPEGGAIIGSGCFATVITVAADANVHGIIWATDVDNIHAADLAVDGNADNTNSFTGTYPRAGIFTRRVSNVVLSNVYATNTWGAGVYLINSGAETNSRNTELTNVTAQACKSDGIKVSNAIRDVFYNGVYARDNGRHGVVIDHSEASSSEIIANANAGVGIYVRNVYSHNLKGLTAKRNQLAGIVGWALTRSMDSSWVAQGNCLHLTSGEGAISDLGEPFDSTGDHLKGDIVIMAGAAEGASYGSTRHLALAGVVAGSDSELGYSRAAPYALYIADGVGARGSVAITGVVAQAGTEGRIRVPETGDIYVEEFVDGVRYVHRGRDAADLLAYDDWSGRDAIGAGMTSGQAWIQTTGTWTRVRDLLSGSGSSTYLTAALGADLRLDVTWETQDSDTMALLFRGIDQNNHLWVALGGTGMQLRKRVGGTNTTLAEGALAWTTNTRHRVTVTVDGAEITVAVDGAEVIAHTLTGGDETTFASADRVGYKVLGANSGQAAIGHLTAQSLA